MPNIPFLRVSVSGLIALLTAWTFSSGAAAPRFKMLVIAQLVDSKGNPEFHAPFVKTGKVWLNKLAADSNFTVTYIDHANKLSDSLLTNADLVWQMNMVPFGWTTAARASYQKYIDAGKGGFMGDHHTLLYGIWEDPNEPKWPWYKAFIGGIEYRQYISNFASGTVRVEVPTHPIFQGISATFPIAKEEWYTWDKSPRSDSVTILANVDEKSYVFFDPSQNTSDRKMGNDHPVIWTNTRVKARNLFIFMGHDTTLFKNEAYTTLLRNSIMWTANKPAVPIRVAGADGKNGPGKIAVRSDRQSVSFSVKGETLRKVSVFDAAGHELFHAEGPALADRIDRSRWEAGSYLVQASAGAKKWARWFELR